MIPAKKIWRQKRLTREENGTDSDDSQDSTEKAREHDASDNEGDITRPSNEAFEVNMVLYFL
jgi:hypothetical protein